MEVKRSEAKQLASDHGCILKSGVSEKLDFLIIGKKSNPCYAQSTYGTKVQKAMEIKVRIISEDRFFELLNSKV